MLAATPNRHVATINSAAKPTATNLKHASMHLAAPGDRLRVTGLTKGGCAGYRHSLLAMGLVPGAEFEVVRCAPLGDPLHIRLGHYDLSLRRAESCLLQVEPC